MAGEQPRSESTVSYVVWTVAKYQFGRSFDYLDLHRSVCNKNENIYWIAVSITMPLQRRPNWSSIGVLVWFRITFVSSKIFREWTTRSVLIGIRSHFSVQSCVVITRPNITWYCKQHCRNSGRLSIWCWTQKTHPIPQPHERAMGRLIWIFVRKLTAL